VRHLIVAHYNEPLLWLSQVAKSKHPWAIHVVSNGVHRPNTGREAGAYIWWIRENYRHIEPMGVYAFLQGDPYPHCANIIDELNVDLVPRWATFADHIAHSDADGSPHHAGLPIAEWHKDLTGRDFPAGGIKFGAGAQFMTKGVELQRFLPPYWDQLAERADWDAGTSMCGGPWVLERLWAEILR
jgi:hypothetical protein